MLQILKELFDKRLDGRLSNHERHVMWRVADLLHIPQGAYVHSRTRAQQAAGAD